MKLRKIAYNILALVAGIVVALGGAEIATRLFAPQRLSGSWTIIGPLGSYMNIKSGVGKNEMPDRTVFYEFNSWHQRGKAEPGPQSVHVLVLGDSLTLGIGLPYDKTYVGLLQAAMDAKLGKGKLQLLNAAAGGSGTADHLAYLEAFGDGLKLSGVVEFVSGDDFNRSLQRDIYRIAGDGTGLIPVDRTSERSKLKMFLENNHTYAFLLEHSHFVQLLRNAIVFGKIGSFGGLGIINQPAPSDGGAAQDAAEQRIARLLFRRMAAWCAARGVQFTVLTTGWPWHDYPWLASTLREEGIEFHDLKDGVSGVIGPNKSKYMILGDGHPNEQGAALIAAAAWPVFEDRLVGLEKK